MGQSARDTLKSLNPVRIRLTQDLSDQIDEAWKSGSHRHIDRQQFLLVLLQMGVDAYEQIYHQAESEAVQHAATEVARKA